MKKKIKDLQISLGLHDDEDSLVESLENFGKVLSDTLNFKCGNYVDELIQSWFNNHEKEDGGMCYFDIEDTFEIMTITTIASLMINADYLINQNQINAMIASESRQLNSNKNIVNFLRGKHECIINDNPLTDEEIEKKFLHPFDIKKFDIMIEKWENDKTDADFNYYDAYENLNELPF